LREHEDEIEALGIKVLVITFEAGPLALAYVKESNIRWPLLVDESRALYAAYGMHRGHWRDILGWSSWRAYAKLLLQGRRLRRSSGDLQQLGGDVLIDPEGVVRLHHVGTGPADRPSVSSLLDVVRGRS
jgi:hypothetical protein